MSVQEVPWVAKVCLLLIFMVSAAPADEAELHAAVFRLTGLKLDGIWLHKSTLGITRSIAKIFPITKIFGKYTVIKTKLNTCTFSSQRNRKFYQSYQRIFSPSKSEFSVWKNNLRAGSPGTFVSHSTGFDLSWIQNLSLFFIEKFLFLVS